MPRMTKADWQLVREAINHALEERDGYRDAHTAADGSALVGYEDTVARCDSFNLRAEAFCQKHFGQPSAFKQDNDRLAAMPTISIFKLGEQ